MFKKLPERILGEWTIIRNAENPESILRRLPDFLKALSHEKKTRPSIAAFEKKLEKAEKEQDQNMAKAIQWVKEKIAKLRTSSYLKQPSIELAIERAEHALQNTENLPSPIHLGLILANLRQAVSNLAAFESDAFFEGWAKTRMPTRQRNPNSNNDNCRTTGLQDGVLEELLLPEFIEHMLSRNGSEGLQRWKSHRESDPATLLGYLKTLSKYSLCESTSEPKYLRARCAQDAEKLCLQGEPRPYLRQYSSDDPKDHPRSREQLLCLIDTFLNMVEGQISQQSDKSLPKINTVQKNDPRVSDKKIAVEWMKSEWSKDAETCQEMIVDRLIRAISNREVKLTRDYKRSTYINWTRNADPLSIAAKLKRQKSKNKK